MLVPAARRAGGGLSRPPRPAVALLLWGDVVEDFLDTIGLTLEGFRDELTGGWGFGYIEALAREGVDMSMVLVSARVTRPTRWVHADTGAAIWILPATRSFRLLRRTPLAPYLATPLRELRRVLRRERCGAIMTQEYEYARFDACVLLGAVMRLPVFASFQGGRSTGRLQRPLRRLTVRRAAGLVIGAGRELARVRERYGLDASRTAQIFNPLDVAPYAAADGREARAALAPADGAVVVVWHGRIDIPQKGLDVLLEAWAEVQRARGGRDALLLVGTGRDAADFRDALARSAVPGVTWIDEYVLDRDRLRGYLAAGDLYVFPSRHEGFPVAPIEAIACGMPVVAADAPGVEDIFPEGEGSGAIVVPRDDPAALAAGLLRLMGDDALRAALAARASARAREAFSLDAVGAQLAGFMRARGLRAR